jgi:hypothetical protein
MKRTILFTALAVILMSGAALAAAIFDATTPQGEANWSKISGGVPFSVDTLHQLSEQGLLKPGDEGYVTP